MKNSVVAFLVGLIFSLGLGIAGMTQPQRIIGFLDPLNWDPSLLFVMAGAVLTHSLFYRFIRRRKTPILDVDWHLPNRKDVTPRLALGAALFGMGWGLGGFCPGPAVTSVASGDPRPVVFVITMLAGMFIYISLEKFIPLKK